MQRQLFKLSSKFKKFITVVIKGPHKCCNESIFKQFAYNFLMRSIPSIDKAFLTKNYNRNE